MNDIPSNEQIAHETGFFENAYLVIELSNQFRVVRRAFAVAPPETVVTMLAQIFFPRFPGRRRILRILGAPILEVEVTAFANFERVRNRFGKIAEELAHLGR